MKILDFQIEPIHIVKDFLQPEWNWISDHNHWTGFHLWYMIRNQVTIQTKEGEYVLSEGDTFLFDLSQNHHCVHDPKNPAAMFTVYFHCDHTEELQQLLRQGVIPKKNHPSLYDTNLNLFEQAVRISNTPEETDLWLAPIFLQLLSPSPVWEKNSKISEICRMIEAAPQKNYNLGDLASQAGYSKNQFIRLFREETGLTPYAYFLHARIARAKYLLLFSDDSATQIAASLGYSSLNHFSSQFFQKTGYYPSEYAAAKRGQKR